MNNLIYLLPIVIGADTILANIKSRMSIQGRKGIAAISSGLSFVLGTLVMSSFANNGGWEILLTIGLSKVIFQYIGIGLAMKLDKEKTLLFTALVDKSTPIYPGAIVHKKHLYFLANSKEESKNFVEFYSEHDIPMHSQEIYKANY